MTAPVVVVGSVLIALLAWDAFRRWLAVQRDVGKALDAYEKAVERLAKDVQALKNEKAAQALGRR